MGWVIPADSKTKQPIPGFFFTLPTTVDGCEILLQLVDDLSHYNPMVYIVEYLAIITKWCRISSIHALLGLFQAIIGTS